jgi:hypothetical protein
MLRIPYCLDNVLTDGGKVISFTRRPRFTKQKHFLVLTSVSVSHHNGHSSAGPGSWSALGPITFVLYLGVHNLCSTSCNYLQILLIRSCNMGGGGLYPELHKPGPVHLAANTPLPTYIPAPRHHFSRFSFAVTPQHL